MEMRDRIGWRAEWIIHKFRDPDNRLCELLRNGASIEEAIKIAGNRYIGREMVEDNIALREGLYLLTGIISGLDMTSAKWDSTNARLGVGDSSTAADASQTGLLGTNKTFKGMDTNYPTRAANESASEQYVEWRATLGSADANYAWNEYTVVNAADDTGKNLNRKVEAKGTKSSGETWTLSLKLSFS